MCSIQTIVRPLLWIALDRLDQLVAFALRQPAGDLVEQQQPRIGGERARHLQPLAVEQRQRAADPVGLRGKAGLLEDLADRVDDLGLALVLAEAGGDQQVLRHRQLLEGMRHLVRAADAGEAAPLRRSLVMSSPSRAMVPALGAVAPVISENSVVLPAPFGPMMPSASPSATDSEMSSVTTSEP